MKGLAVGAENLQAAESLIRDTDMAAQMVEFVKDRILVQSSTAMLAQANTKPQTVLQLFR
jgi:flagellin